MDRVYGRGMYERLTKAHLVMISFQDTKSGSAEVLNTLRNAEHLCRRGQYGGGQHFCPIYTWNDGAARVDKDFLCATATDTDLASFREKARGVDAAHSTTGHLQGRALRCV